MIHNNKYQNYLWDLGRLTVEKALEAKRRKEAQFLNKDDCAYQLGYLMAYHEIIDLMKQQAIVFDIDENEMGLADINPESDLL